MAAPSLKDRPQKVEIDDIQGIVVRGYGSLQGARFLALRFEDSEATRRWLRQVLPAVTRAGEDPGAAHLNVAFTYGALEKLGLHPDALAGFPTAFAEGMVGPRRDTDGEPLSHRSEILGDVGDSAPRNWIWGNEERPVDVALLLYTRNAEDIEPFAGEHQALLQKHGLEIVYWRDPVELYLRKEHFGFRDGISQPSLRNSNPPARQPGVLEEGPPHNTVEPGDFILGYRNHYGQYTFSPSLPASEDPSDILPDHHTHEAVRDFGKNGSFLVWRQLGQEVREFWKFIRRNATDDAASRRKLASKLVGRWPSGAPLVLSPSADNPALADANDFGYVEPDPHGFHVPFGSHIRRANPRDWHLAPKPKEAIQIANRHRIIRRARPYGKPLHDELDPEAMLAAEHDHGERGLQFLAFMVDIERQFEFIQQNWLQNPKFANVDDELDPVLGAQPPESGSFTLQDSPIRRRLRGLTRYVDVRGGGYFMMPGISALEYLASLTGTSERTGK